MAGERLTPQPEQPAPGRRDEPVYSEHERERLGQFDFMLRSAYTIEDRLKNGESLARYSPNKRGEMVHRFPVREDQPQIFRRTAFNMYTEYFSGDPRLKDAARDVMQDVKADRATEEYNLAERMNHQWPDSEWPPTGEEWRSGIDDS